MTLRADRRASYNTVYDAQGDVVGLLNSSGELVQTIPYGPYGENTDATGMSYSPTSDPFLFQGGYQMPGGDAGEGNVPNGLYHYGERYYDPTTGRWTQPEPLSGTPEYAFAGDDPVNADDPKEACSKSHSSEISGYAYDGVGNEIAINGYAEPESTSFSYNNLNQLKDLTPPSLSEQALTYFGSGQSNLTGVGSTTVQNSALGIASQTNESGTSYYARTPAGIMIDEGLPGGASYNPVYDAQGDVIGLLNSSGELKQTIRYGPHGENTTAAGTLSYSATNDPFLFQGGYHMVGGNVGAGNVPNGLYHFGERYDDPTTGRWTQPDPEGGTGSYMFDEDDPVNESDPEGTCPFDRDLSPSVSFSGGYAYWEICGTHGRSAGRRVGYLRLKISTYEKHKSELGGRIIAGTAGTVVAAGGIVIGAICIATSEDTGPAAIECVKAGAIPFVTGGLADLFAAAEE